MCFSATASFAASGGLALVGVASVKAAPKKKRILAVVPFLFAAQQALEGIQWLSLGSGTTCQAAGYGYLTFAFIVWPLLIPALVYIFDPASRRHMWFFLAVGLLVAGGYARSLLLYPLSISTIGRHIAYQIQGPFGGSAIILYGVAVVGSLWASSVLIIRRFGVIVFGSGLLALAIEREAFASVWCFFAAVTSVLIYFSLRRR